MIKITNRKYCKAIDQETFSRAYYVQGRNDIRTLEEMVGDDDFTLDDVRRVMTKMSPSRRQRMEKSYTQLIHSPAHALKGFISDHERRSLIGAKRL